MEIIQVWVYISAPRTSRSEQTELNHMRQWAYTVVMKASWKSDRSHSHVTTGDKTDNSIISSASVICNEKHAVVCVRQRLQIIYAMVYSKVIVGAMWSAWCSVDRRSGNFRENHSIENHLLNVTFKIQNKNNIVTCRVGQLLFHAGKRIFSVCGMA